MSSVLGLTANPRIRIHLSLTFWSKASAISTALKGARYLESLARALDLRSTSSCILRSSSSLIAYVKKKVERMPPTLSDMSPSIITCKLEDLERESLRLATINAYYKFIKSYERLFRTIFQFTSFTYTTYFRHFAN
jgi:hypothetical protein